MADKFPCIACRKDVTATKNDRYRSHSTGEGEPCDEAGEPIPEHVLANGPVDGKTPKDVPVEGVDYALCGCGRKVPLTRLGYFEDHDRTLRGGDRCDKSGTRFRRKVEDVELPAPSADGETTSSTAPVGDPAKANLERYPMESAPDADSSASTGKSSPESSTTSKPSPEPEIEPSNEGPFSLGVTFSDRFLQPFSPFLQPPEYLGPVKAEPMTDRGKEIATRLKEIFYAYSNRKTSDNRSAQTTLGPSEIGTPCDRRLAMSLMGVDPVNPGGDGWAAFVGTAVHVSLDEMFTWASANTGRFETEMRLQFGSPFVPKGTGDLLDRVMCMFLDHKLMGQYSLKKLRERGPSDTYRVQIHTYAYGAILGGEKVKDVAIIGWPRAGSSLDELYVWTEKYDKKVALDALARVERIHQETRLARGPNSPMEIAREFPTSDKYECKYCPFSLPGDKQMQRGCPGPEKS